LAPLEFNVHGHSIDRARSFEPRFGSTNYFQFEEDFLVGAKRLKALDSGLAGAPRWNRGRRRRPNARVRLTLQM